MADKTQGAQAAEPRGDAPNPTPTGGGATRERKEGTAAGGAARKRKAGREEDAAAPKAACARDAMPAPLGACAQEASGEDDPTDPETPRAASSDDLAAPIVDDAHPSSAEDSAGDAAPAAPLVAEVPAAWAREPDPRAVKHMLRARFKMERDSMPLSDHARDSAAVCRKLLGLEPVCEGAKVALYAPIGSELALAPFVRGAAETLTLLAPVVLPGGHMAFVQVTPDELLASHTRQPDFLAHPARVQETLPEGRAAVAAAEIDLLVVPGLAFDRTCRRLGYGGGYYDAFLAREDLRALVAGVCFDEQFCERPLPAEEHDRRMDVVLTPTETIELA